MEIFFGVLVAVMILLIIAIKTKTKKLGNFWDDFNAQSRFEKERVMLRTLQKTQFAKYSPKTPKDLSKNMDKLEGLIEDGATAVFCGGIVSVWKNLYINVVMPNAVITKRDKNNDGQAWEYDVDSRFTERPWVVPFDETISTRTEKKQSSVVGQALVGGAIAGGVGAVVGAANAVSQNAVGGKTHTSKTTTTRYCLKYNFLGGGEIDTILISTSVFERIGQPPEKFVVKKNEKYWCLQAVESFSRRNHGLDDDLLSGVDSAEHEKLKKFIDKLFDCYKANDRHNTKTANLVLAGKLKDE